MNKSACTSDLTQEMEIKTSDELGVLARAFNEGQKTFRSIIAQLVNVALKINSASNEILAAANQQESAATEQATQTILLLTPDFALGMKNRRCVARCHMILIKKVKQYSLVP